MEIIDDRAHPSARPYLVVATDAFMTRWGRECSRLQDDKTSVAAWACYSLERAEDMAEAIRLRPEMKRVRTIHDADASYRPRGCGHFHIYAIEPDESTPEYRVKHLCELAARNEVGVYNAAMRAFRDGSPGSVAPVIADRILSPSWYDRSISAVGRQVVGRIAFEVAYEYRARLLADDPNTQFKEAI